MAALQAKAPASAAPTIAQPSAVTTEFTAEDIADSISEEPSTAPQTSAAEAAEIAAISAAQPAPAAAIDAAAAVAVAIATQQNVPVAQPIKKPAPIDDDSWMTGVPVGRPVSNRSTGYRRRSTSNATIELLKIVMGGVVGLALGYAVLRYGFNIDLAKLSQQASATTASDQSQAK